MGILKNKTTEEILSIIDDVVSHKIILDGEDKEEAYEIISSIYTAKWLECALTGAEKKSGQSQWQVEKAHQTLIGCYNMQAIRLENKLKSEGKVGDELVIKFELDGPSDCEKEGEE